MYFRLSLYLAEKTPLRRESNTVPTRVWNAFLDCIYLLLKASLGRGSNTLPQRYGMYFSWLYLLLVENSAGESVKYSSTGIWNVF